jgi:hypothetical protein
VGVQSVTGRDVQGANLDRLAKRFDSDVRARDRRPSGEEMNPIARSSFRSRAAPSVMQPTQPSAAKSECEQVLRPAGL